MTEMRSARRRAATTKRSSTAGAPGGAKSTNVRVCATRERTTSRGLNLKETLNHYAVIVLCPGTAATTDKACDFMTDVYGQADCDMWEDEGLLYPACPKCGSILIKAEKQYVELD